MNAHDAYSRAKLAASDAQLATLCDQMTVLCHSVGRGEAPNPLPVHRLLAEKTPTPLSRQMHGALALLLDKVAPCDEPLGVEHAHHFVVTGVRQAAAQFAIETETVLAALKWQPIDTAPTDGSEFLGWDRDTGCRVLCWRITAKKWVLASDFATEYSPTFWQSLPINPQ